MTSVRHRRLLNVHFECDRFGRIIEVGRRTFVLAGLDPTKQLLARCRSSRANRRYVLTVVHDWLTDRPAEDCERR
ncbi:hypothetical protein MSIMFI_05308 [Mycobacterium simulans]|nr:hypothetical protein MSIMFI_05308 [Mycobacterium simulans]